MASCSRCNGQGRVVVAVLYPNPPARLIDSTCPGCGGRGELASDDEATRLLAERQQVLEEAKQEVPWLRSRRIFGDLRERGATEFVVMGARW